MKKQVYAYIGKTRAEYAGAFYALSEPGCEAAYASAAGFFLCSDVFGYISAKTQDALDAMRPHICQDMIVSYDGIADALLEACGYQRDLVCYNTAYEHADKLPVVLPEGVDIRPLSHADDDFVIAHYSHADGRPDYVIERIEAGMLGLYEGGVLAGFIGTHDSGEMGLLEILPAYRRKGYARLLEAALINRQLDLGLYPYGNVETNNEASLKLQRSLGMTISKGLATWYVR